MSLNSSQQIVDDTDPSIQYIPPGIWSAGAGTGFEQNYNGTAHFTSTNGSMAKFNFNGKSFFQIQRAHVTDTGILLTIIKGRA
jgi:hypothetical protein